MRIHSALFHPDLAPQNPELWVWVTTLVLFSNSDDWYRKKASGIEFAKKQFLHFGLSEAEAEKNVREMIAPPPSPETLRVLYLATDRFVRYGQAPGTVKDFISFGDVFPSPKGAKGWSHPERQLSNAVIKAMSKAYLNAKATVIPLTTSTAFWLFLGAHKALKDSEWFQLFWLASNTLRVGLLRSTELLYNGKIGRLITLADLEIGDKSIFEYAEDQDGSVLEAVIQLQKQINGIPYWSIFVEYTKTIQDGKGTKVFISKGNETFPLLRTLLELLEKRARTADRNGDELQYADPLLMASSGEVLNYKRFELVWEILTDDFNNSDTKFTIYSHRKGGASDLLKCGYSLPQIKILGRWSLGVQDYYFRLEPEKIVEIQEQALLKGPPGSKSMATEEILEKIKELEGPETDAEKVWAKSGWASALGNVNR